MIRSFLAGALVGGLIVWQWREEIQDYLSARTRGVRQSAADRLQTVEETAERYRRDLVAYYGVERRWPDRPFWRRRHGQSVVASHPVGSRR